MTKQNNQDLPLRDAFPPMPADCYDALMRAARSAKEETNMKRFTAKTILIAAILAILTMAAALAAGEMLGWTDFFSQYGDQAIVPNAAREIMNETEPQRFELGALTFTLRQLMCDGRLAVSTTDIRTTDGSPALYCFDPYDTLGCNGENGRQLAARLGLPWETTYMDAAKQLKLPLYWCQATLECQDYAGGMGDPLWNDDNTMTLFDMAYLEMTEMPEKLDAELFLWVATVDSDNVEESAENALRTRVSISVPVHAETEEKTYLPAEPFSACGLTLQSVRAERTIAGAYLYADFTVEEGVDLWEVYTGEHIRFLNENGQPFPIGMSLSGSLDEEHFPTVIVGDMIAVDELPAVFIVAVGDARVTVK